MPKYVHVFFAIMVALLWVSFLGGCAGLQEGPAIDLNTTAVPKVVEDAQDAPPPAPTAPAPGPLPQPRAGFRAWIPRQVTPNGDVHAGHYVEVSPKAPQKELSKPDYHIPKAPKHIYRPPAKATGAAGTGTGRRPVEPLSSVPPSLMPQAGTPPHSPAPPEGLYDAVQP